jgi:transcription elongation GreA/GreB family factor
VFSAWEHSISASVHKPSSQQIIVSRPSLQTLAETLDKHTNAKFAAQREARVAKEWGDLSENAEYKASKEKFRLAGRLQQRVGRELKALQNQGYIVVDPLDWARAEGLPSLIEVGVVVRITQANYTENYLVAGAKDTHLPENASLVVAPYTSPLGQALYGKAAPARVEVALAGEVRLIEIHSLRRPTVAEIIELYPELSSP